VTSFAASPQHDDRVAAHAAAYREAMAAKRQHIYIGLAVLLVMIGLAAYGAEVNLAKLWENRWRFLSYFTDIAPVLRWNSLWPDLQEWFWGLDIWLKLLGETILIAYVGTILGFAAAFFLSFKAAANLTPRASNETTTNWFGRNSFVQLISGVPARLQATIFGTPAGGNASGTPLQNVVLTWPQRLAHAAVTGTALVLLMLMGGTNTGPVISASTTQMGFFEGLFDGLRRLAMIFLFFTTLWYLLGTLALTRRFLEFCRTVPEIVFALIFVIAFGLGPIPGVLAIAIHTTGALGKLFSEVVENIDMKPLDGVTATGATWWQGIRFAVVPQVISNFASYALLRFEINVRGASVMGFVGAGGIGQDLIEAIRKFYFSDVSALLLLIILTVVIIDLLTERLRHRFLDVESRA
jgi:ABC-type phosphate/phosphonate transport system permease subunit